MIINKNNLVLAEYTQWVLVDYALALGHWHSAVLISYSKK